MNKMTWECWGIIIVCIMASIVGCVWTARLAVKYENIKRHMTKRINAVITGKVRMRYTYIYTFIGLDEYEGVAFCDKWLESPAEHEIGETVSLLINEHNPEEFWFEGAKNDYGKYAIIFGVLAIICLLFFIEGVSL